MEHLGRGPVAQGLMGSLVIVEPDVGSHFPPCLGGVGVGFQVHLLVLQRPPQPLHLDVVGVPALPVHADLHPVFLQHLGELQAGKRLPWSVLQTSGWTCSSASCKASTQQSASRVLDNRHATTYRLCQSMMATK